jgi:perosamine synthetase
MSIIDESRRPRLRLAHPDVGDAELEAIRRVFASGILTNGDETVAFEEEFALRHGARHGVAFANGTVALAGLFLALDIGPGDDVVVPSFTFISTATSVLHVGARPVFADIDPDTFNLDPDDVARRLTPNTKAIVAVHYGGQSADLAPLRTLADERGIVLLEDAAEAHGATYEGRPVGAIGHAGMFSFTPTKNITTGEGGLVTTDDGALADRLRLLRNHGQTDRYVHGMLGYNWRLTEMQAAMGRVQLEKLDEVLARKRAAAARLTARLADVDGIRPPVVRPDRDHVFMLFTTVVEDDVRDELLDGLIAAGIEARLYFPPAHRQPVFGAHAPAELPVTDWAARHALSLPLHARLTLDELDEIAATVDRLLRSF